MARSALVFAAATLATTVPTSSAEAEAPHQPADRVLLLSLPTLSWADLHDAPVPHLRALLDQSSVASLSVRTVRRTTTAGDAYATVGAGSRASGLQGLDGLAFDSDELYRGERAAGTYTRRQGVAPGPGPFLLGATPLRSRNSEGAYGARLGALGGALADAGITRAVVANADRDAPLPEGQPDERYGREAALALAGSLGRVPAGSVGVRLLEADGGASFGQRLSEERVLDTFRAAWQPRSVVLVEASDLARLDAERPFLSARREGVLLERVLRSTDALVGQLVQQVDPRRDAVVLMAPYHRAEHPQLTVFALRAPGIRPGMLDSATTRRPGFVSLEDIGPTVLDLVGVEAPPTMSGAPVHEVAPGPVRRSELVAADEEAQFRDRMLTPVTVAVVLLTGALLLLCALALGGHHGARRGARVCALVVLAFLPATYLAGVLPFERWGPSAYWAFIAATSVAFATVTTLLGRRDRQVPVLLALATVAGVLVADMLAGAPLQLNTVFGYSPIQGGRFAGLPNVGFAQLTAAGVLLVGLLAPRLGRRRGVLLGGTVLMVIVLVDGLPMWGADVGGVLTLVPVTGLVLAMLLGLRLRARALAGWLAAGVMAVMVIGLVDLARPAQSRTHLGRLLASTSSEGWPALATVLERKLGANLAAVTNTAWLLMVPVAGAFAIFVARRAPDAGRALWRHGPELRAALVGLAVAMVLGFMLNDSGIAVPAAMLAVTSGALAHLLMAVDPAVALGPVNAASSPPSE